MSKDKKSITFMDVLRFGWRYWSRYPMSMAFVGIGLLGVTAMQVLQPYLAGQLIDIVASGPDRTDAAVMTLMLFIAAMLATEFFHVFRDYVWITAAVHCMTEVLQDSFVRVQRFSTEWHANNFAGATVRKMTRGRHAFDMFGDTLVYGFIPTLLILAGTTGLLAWQWPTMALFAVPMIALYLGVTYVLMTRYVAPVNKQMAEIDSELGGVLADAVTCNATVKAFGAETREDARTLDMGNRWRDQANRTWTRHVNSGAALSVFRIVMQAGLLSITLWFWARGAATPGQVTLVLTTYMLLNGYLREVGMHMRNMQEALNDMEDIVKFDDMPIEITDAQNAEEFDAAKGRIEFRQVGFGYANQDRQVYRDFSITIRPGEKIALVGKSGSGKSTFVKLVQRLHDVSNGAVVIDGQDVREVTQESLRQAIAIVPQEPILFHRSLGENIAYGRPGADQAQIEEAAKRAHAHGFITSLNEGYETLVGERGVKLSGGERQRVALARAFLADAPVLILDEATSSLDSITEVEIQEAIEDLMEGRTTILIAHRLSTIKSVDRILVFSEGRIVEQGSHNELMTKPHGHYRALYLTQHGDDALSA